MTPGRWSPFTSMRCCKLVWELLYTHLRRSSSIAATSSTMACLSSWIVMIRLRNTRSFRNPHRKKIWYSKFGRPSRPSDVAETRDDSSEHCCTFQRSIATDLMKWPSLLYRFPSRQPRQAIAPGKYSNLKCVSWLHATLYHFLYWWDSRWEGMRSFWISGPLRANNTHKLNNVSDSEYYVLEVFGLFMAVKIYMFVSYFN